LLIFFLIKSIFGQCSYVYDEDAGNVWSTNVCIKWNQNSNYYIKYLCPTAEYMSAHPNATVNVTFYYDAVCENQFLSYDIQDYMNTYNVSIGFSFYCANQTNSNSNYNEECYVEYTNNCYNQSNELLYLYSPIDTCILHTSRKYSFKYTCSFSQFVYYKYNSSNCDVNSLINEENITECAYYSLLQKHAQFISCRLLPTSAPTLSPITPSPTQPPSIYPTMLPSYYIPFYNVNIDNLINEFGGTVGSYSSSGYTVNSNLNLFNIILLLIWLTFISF